MASAFVLKRKLSGSTDGKGIKVVNTTSGTADTIHQAQSGTTAGCYDEIWLYAVNNDIVARVVSICWGGTAAEDIIAVELPARGEIPFCLVNGWLLQNSLYVKAYASAANVVSIHGFVNQITEA